MAESNTIEGIQNSMFGTPRCAQAAVDAGVSTSVLISTDRAIRPTSAMDASKRVAGFCLQALTAEPEQKTCLCMVRFDNVLGSSGSVAPVFEKQITRSGPIALTRRDVIHYFIIIPKAAQLAIWAGAIGKGGDVLVPGMGESVKIIDLAHQMIVLNGLKVKDEQHPHSDIEIKITGLRPGEKLYEELFTGDEVQKTTHPRVIAVSEVMFPRAQLSDILLELQTACLQSDQNSLYQLLLRAPTGFVPKDGICDLVWQQNNKAI